MSGSFQVLPQEKIPQGFVARVSSLWHPRNGEDNECHLEVQRCDIEEMVVDEYYGMTRLFTRRDFEWIPAEVCQVLLIYILSLTYPFLFL